MTTVVETPVNTTVEDTDTTNDTTVEDTDNDCPICFEKFTSKVRRKITCPVCEFESCFKCIYNNMTTNKSMPKCLSCGAEWSEYFQYQNFGYHFVNKKIKNLRKDALFEKEKNLIPQEIEVAKFIKMVEDDYNYAIEKYSDNPRQLIEQYDDIQKQLKEIPSQIRELKNKYYEDLDKLKTKRNMLHNTSYNLRSKKEYLKELYKFKKNLDMSNNIVNTFKYTYLYYYLSYDINGKYKGYRNDFECYYNNIKRYLVDNVKPPDTESINKTYIKQCPCDDCNGFLTSKYICELCNTKVCSKCFDITQLKGEKVVSGDGNEEHICNPDNIASAELIKKSTKPCPKCCVRIHKLSGCDQMWCTECNIAFSWNTGKIDTGHIHNPHYFQWLRNNPQNMNIRQILANPCADDIPTITEILNIISRDTGINGSYLIIRQKVKAIVTGYHEKPETTLIGGIQHITDLIEKNNNFINNNAINKTLRVKYLLGLIDETEYKNKLNIFYKKYNKIRSFTQIYQILVNVITDNLMRITQFYVEKIYRKNLTKEILDDFGSLVDNSLQTINKITEFCNNELKNCGELYKNKYPQIKDYNYYIKQYI